MRPKSPHNIGFHVDICPNSESYFKVRLILKYVLDSVVDQEQQIIPFYPVRGIENLGTV